MKDLHELVNFKSGSPQLRIIESLDKDAPCYRLYSQSDLLSDLGSRLVIPLRRAAAWGNVPLPVRLCPVFRIDGEDFVLETPRMAAVPAIMLKSAVCSLQAEQAQITAALDFVFQGH